MAQTTPPGARTSPSTARNREPLLAILKPRLPSKGLVLEIASGAGEHAVFNAAALPHLQWQPTDPDPEALVSIAAWRAQAGLPNLLAPLRLDAADSASWPVDRADAIININMIHIAPWAAAQGLFTGAAQRLAAGGLLLLYGPYLEENVATAASNLAFDESLRSRDPAWGLRRLADVTGLAREVGLTLEERLDMPANNLALVFRRG